MNDNVALDNFFFILLDLFFIHGLNFVVSFKIGFFEVLELSLEFLELSGDTFVFGCEVFVLFFEGLVSTVVLFSEISEFSVENTLLFF